MVAVVNTNVMSLNAQRQLNKSQGTQNEAMERLSSGLRINSAKDDAAGLAISTGMQSQIKGINQAVRNANDGVSMTQTAEGSMDEMTNILQRMRELSVQSANDTNSADNRASIQTEVDQLSSELDRIAETTEFNGTKLLNGTAGSTTLQIGANSGQTVSFSIDSVTTNDLGLNGDLNKGELNSGRVGSTATDAADLLVNGEDVGAVAAKLGNQAGAVVDAINLKTADTGVTASAYNVVQGDSESTTVTGITDGMTIKAGSAGTVTLGATSSMDNLVETINRDVAGVTASKGDSGELLLTNDNGEDIVVGGSQNATSGIADDTYTGFVALDSADNTPIAITGADPTNAGFLESNGAGSMVTQAATAASATSADKLTINGEELTYTGAGTASASADAAILAINALTDKTGVTASTDTTVGQQITLSSADGKAIEILSGADTQTLRDGALTKVGMGVEMGGKVVDSLGVNVSTMDGASSSITKIDDALDKISSSRANLGAIQNRLGSTISNLENVSQNLSASNSRIQDADFAAETSKMSKAQILQQAGTSMLSQANASAQSVLSLLG
ncbi:MAG: flagellin [Oleiphilaceae bacterium]|jgi:flagellin